MITEEMKKLIGATGEPIVMEVEKGAIKRYAQAVDDSNPLFCDEEYAMRTQYGTLICPPGFFGWPVKPSPMRTGVRGDLLNEFAKAGFPIVLDGGIEYDFMIPIRAGDILISYVKIADVYEKTGRTGTSLFGIIETIYKNQNGDVVTIARATMIGRPGA